jgi:hypothetical protein
LLKKSWRLLIIDYWLLIIDYWLLIIDYWLLIIDYWLCKKQTKVWLNPPAFCLCASENYRQLFFFLDNMIIIFLYEFKIILLGKCYLY